MNHPEFTALRRRIDEAITFDDQDLARHWVGEGLHLAQRMRCPAEALYFNAQEAVIEERFEDAIGLLEEALILNLSDGAAYNDIALCLVETGKIEGVLEIFDKGIAVESDYATIHHNKGWFLNKLGASNEALVCFNKALSFEPERVVTWENMANVYEELGQIPEALNAYQKALLFLQESGRETIRQQLQAEIKRLEAV